MESGSRLRELLLVIGICLCFVPACSSTRTTTNTPRTSTEQLLVSEAANRSLAGLSWPHLADRSVFVKTVSSGKPEDEEYLRTMARTELAERGAMVVDRPKDADYVATVVASSLGTEQWEMLLGAPAMQSAFLPVPFPEIALYKSVRQEGFAKTELVVTDARTGHLIDRAGPANGKTYTADYKILMLGFRRTDTDRQEQPVHAATNGDGLPAYVP